MTAQNSPNRPAIAPVEHVYRRTDLDPRAAKRAERQVAIMFALSGLMAVLFVVAYVAIPQSQYVWFPVLGEVLALHVALGVTFGLSIFLIGAGAIHWAKKLMSDVEMVEERHEFGSSAQDIADLQETLAEGVEDSGIGRLKIVRRTLLGALALFPVPIVVLLRDLGPDIRENLKHTMWRSGTRLVRDITYEPIRPEEIEVGALVNAVPEGLHELEEREGNQNERAKAVIVVVKISPDEIISQQGGTAAEPWDYNGVLAYSKVCTHVGCPISLYERRSHLLLCPCHQSQFDLADSGRVVFGPAIRRMPQLAITVDAEGYLVARGDFAEPIGPSFWEMS